MMTSRFFHSAVSLLLLLSVAACSGVKATRSGSGVSKHAPGWFREQPADGRKYVYAAGMGSGSRPEIAQAKAETAAKLQLARKLSEKVEGLQKTYLDEVGTGGDQSTADAFTQAVKTITNAQLVGAGVLKTETVALKKNGGYEAYVLVRMPTGRARKQIVERLAKEPNVFDKLSQSESFRRFLEHDDVDDGR